MKFYKDTDGIWYADEKNIIVGDLRFIISSPTEISIYWVGTRQPLYNGLVTGLQTSAGASYTDMADFLTACGSFFVNPLNPLKEDVEGLKLNKADLVEGKVPSDQLPSYVDDVVNIEHFSSTEPVALEDELWYDTVNHDLAVYDGEAWIAVVMDYGRIYVNVDTTSDSYNSTFRYNGVSLILLGANVTRTFLEGILQTRTVAIPAYDIDMALGEDFTKTCAAASVFTISNPIIKKAFRLFITGGTLGTPLFTGYTSNWILGALPIDYNPAIENILICEIRSAGQIYLFWGE